MPVSITLQNNKKQKFGFNILDQTGTPFASLPDGTTQVYTSSDPAITTFEAEPSPTAPGYAITGWAFTTNAIGTAIITAEIDFPNDEAPAFTDTIAVAVTNSSAASLGAVAIGDPVDDV